MPELLLAIDAGTTTARAALFSPAGAQISLAGAPLHTRSPAPGLMEQDALAVWRTVRRVIAQALRAAGRSAADIAAIGITSQRTSAVIWDRRTSRPLTPLVLWSDLRGVARAAALREQGVWLAPQQAAAKLEAMRAGVDGAGRDLAWGNIDAFLIWKLSGGAVHATDRSQAWPTGYLDLATMCWNAGLIARQGLDQAMFPALTDTFGPIAVTDPAVFGATAPITADIADQQSALIAHGGAAAAKITFGTSATLDVGTGANLVFKSPATPPFILSSVGGQATFCIEGMVISAGAALEWVRRLASLGNHGRFDSLAARAEGAAGAAFLPSLSGLGAPAPDPGRTELITGLTPGISRSHLARAAMEGVAFRVREVTENIFEPGGPPAREMLGVDGGLAASGVFLQIQADLLGRPLRRHAVREATAAGAAMCAGRGAGLLSPGDVAAFVRYDAVFEPRLTADEAAAHHRAWRRAVYGSSD